MTLLIKVSVTVCIFCVNDNIFVFSRNSLVSLVSVVNKLFENGILFCALEICNNAASTAKPKFKFAR